MSSFVRGIRDIVRRSPWAYRNIRLAYANIRFVWNFTRQGIWRGYFTVVTDKSDQSTWQAPLEWKVTGFDFASAGDLIAQAKSRGVVCMESRHTVYFPPQSALRELLPDLTRHYPDNAGFKVLKDFRPAHEAEYLIAEAGARWRQRVLGPPRQQMTAANRLFHLGLGPRIHDICMWRSASAVCTSFVVEHIAGDTPTQRECEQFIPTLLRRCEENDLKVLVTDVARTSDFQCPDCNGNVIRGTNGRLQYVDFQNFALWPHAAWLKRAVREAAGSTHFGLEHKVRGGKYLYQSVPGTGDRGKRDTDKRWHYLERMLEDHGISLERRLVLDVGCNAGMMLNSALARGAHWGLGWDRAAVIPHSEQLLLSLGASRFNLFGRDLHPRYRLEEDIPAWLTPYLGESVVFYLSVRQHVGLLESLTVLPWRVLVYEGHQRESATEIQDVLGGMLGDGVRIAARMYLADGDSARRPLAILIRGTVAPTAI